MKIRIITLLLILLPWVASSQKRQTISASSTIITETRTVGSFDNISVSSGIAVELSQGARHVEVKTSDNVMPFIETYVKGATLVIKVKENTILKVRKELTVLVTAPDLDAVSVSGGSRVTVRQGNYASNSNLAFSVSGGANITGNFSCRNFSASISGGGRVNANIASSGRAAISTSGGGTFKGDVTATGSGSVATSGGGVIGGSFTGGDLAISASGGGRVELQGRCSKASVAVSGGGRAACPKLVCQTLKGSSSGGGFGEFIVTGDIVVNNSGGGRFVTRNMNGDVTSGSRGK